jgi:xanthine/CO dehydrogenase XdhC/CoxF family maturation factor
VQELKELFAAVNELEAAGFSCRGALATLTRTRGSTFRRAGASMLVRGDGRVVRALSGGCPQKDIAARAQRVIERDSAEVVRYDREYGLDALMEMGCGGELEVLIEPLACAADMAFIRTLESCMRERTPCSMATVFALNGECMARRPRRLIWTQSVVADEVRNDSLSGLIRSRANSEYPGRSASSEMIRCGDDFADVLIERIDPPHALVIVGLNAVSIALSSWASKLGWHTTVVDSRDDHADLAALPPHVSFVKSDAAGLGTRVRFDGNTSAMVMTHNLGSDIDYLKVLGNVPLQYIGALSSRRRAEEMRSLSGLNGRLHAPAGLDIGSDTPEEIALSVAAEIQAVLSGRAGTLLSAAAGPIH